MTDTPRLHIGSAYYPEHWPEERWAEDIHLMVECGLTVARMGEFAWSTLEPSKGNFQFEWLDKAIQLLADNGIQTVLGTPTAAPPAWLVAEHPEILAVDDDGRRVQFGNRCHYCVNSFDMHTASQRIVSAMAAHFGPNPNVIGWQIDNEFNRVCYCDVCKSKFQSYLSEKYKTLEELNRRWSAAYWSQTYSGWEQIPIPIGPHNPALMLEWKRFITQSYRNFQALQIGLIREHAHSDAWITHNFMGWFDGFDHYDVSADLDMASWDYYVGQGHNDPSFSASCHDLTRGFLRKNFWVMETQPGTVNWARINNSLYKGEGRTMAWEAVAHGADGILYWQWRAAPGSHEQFHGTLLDQSGQPRPFYEEVKQIAAEFKQAGAKIMETNYPARVAILNDYESRWSIYWQKHHKDFDYVAHLEHYYRPLAQANIPVDIISPDQSLKDYRLIIAPAMIITDDQRFALLKEFVERGGYLILTPRTAMKNRDNALLPARQPEQLAGLAGVEVREFFALNEDVPIKGNWFTGVSRTWAEYLNIFDSNLTMTVARYGESNGWLDDQPAISVKAVKAGMIYYVGAYLDDASQAAFLSRVAQVSGVKSVMETPTGVSAARRINKDRKEFTFVINHTRKEQLVSLGTETYDDQISGKRYAGQLKLPPYGVVVLNKAM